MAFDHGSRINGATVVMRIVSALELVSLVVILSNRFSIQSPVVTSTGGPIHGLLYVSTIVLALLLPFPRSAKWLAIIPGVGGLLALWHARRVDTRETRTVPFTAVNSPPLTEHERANAAIIVEDATATLSTSSFIGPLTFTVPRGGVTGLIGPNGAGKTTALRLLCGLIAPSGGTLVVRPEGVDLDPEHPDAAPIGVLIDSPGFVPGLTARNNLLALTRLAAWSPSLVNQALNRVGLLAASEQRVGTFSLGMKQRLGLAAALLGQPRIVILDEPTNGLDPRGTIELRAFLHSLAAEGITVIIASHALDEIEELCDHLVAMDRGHVFFNGPPDQMLRAVPTTIRCRVNEPAALASVLAAFERDGQSGRKLDDVTVAVTGSASLGERLNRLATGVGITLSEIAVQRPTLQDAFLALTGDPTGNAREHEVAMNEVTR